MNADPCPECRAGKCDNCDERSWNFDQDDYVPCPCWLRGHAAQMTIGMLARDLKVGEVRHIGGVRVKRYPNLIEQRGWDEHEEPT